MKLKKTFLYILFISLLMNSCRNFSKSNSEDNQTMKIEKLNWLIGTWQQNIGVGMLYEKWQKKNDSLYTAESFSQDGDKVTLFETIELKQSSGDLFYIPTVIGYNDNKPVTFKLISDENGVFVFENKEHDFPQRIKYSNPQPDTLAASIEGNVNGKFEQQQFNFSRK